MTDRCARRALCVALMPLILASCSIFQMMGFTVPDAPTGLAVSSPTTTSLALSWNPSPGAMSYQAFRSAASSGPWTNQVYDNKDTGFTDSSLSPGTAYFYVVKAVNAAGGSAPSAVISATTGISAAAAPTFSPVGGSYTSAQNVTISTTTGGASIRYTIDGSTPSNSVGILYSSPVVVSTSLILKAVAFVSGMTDSPVAAASYTISTSTIAAPTGLTVGSPTTSSLAVSWNAVPGATSYQVFRDTSAAGYFSTQVFDGSVTSFTDTGLASGGTYYYKARASDASGFGPLSAAVPGTVTISSIMQIPGSGTFTYSLDLGSDTRSVYFVFSNPTTLIASAPQVNGANVQPPASLPSPRSMISGGTHGLALKDRPDPTGFNRNPFSRIAPRRSSRAIVTPPNPRLDAVGATNSFMDRYPTDLIPATCRKIVVDTAPGGTDRTLNIWVADDCWYIGGSAQNPYHVDGAMVDAVANAFLNAAARNDDIYDWVTNIYGVEYGTHSDAYLIPPDNQITILLYDIDGDHSANGGTLGFYWAKDQFIQQVVDNSNQRVMFYLDAVLLATPDPPSGSWDLTDYWPQELISTLAHEFQHMINYYQKTILLGGSSVAWIDEMASMVTEDLVADKLHLLGPRGIVDDPTAGSPNNIEGRLPYYNAANSYSLFNWGSPDLYASYSIGYAFGAYLARNFGGAQLFRDIVLNNRTDSTALDYALGLSQNGSGETFSSVFWKWGVANLISDNTAAPDGFKYNKGGFFTSTIANTIGPITYNLGSINLFNYKYQTQIGPMIWTSSPVGVGSQFDTSNLLFLAGAGLTGPHSWQITLPAGENLTVVLK